MSESSINEKELAAQQRMFMDTGLKLNVSFSIKEGFEFTDFEKHYLDTRNHTIQSLLIKRERIFRTLYCN